MIATVDSVADLRDAVRTAASETRLLPVGGGTKPALSGSERAEVASLDVSALSGIVAYDPEELTLTARAGTPVAEIADELAAAGQYLPCDPPLAAQGATLGGTVAAGASGPGAFRHGGLRNFVIGVQIVDGTGRLIQGGGRVVKNAAGFDLPKLMVGSLGRLGVITLVSLKVFPAPRATLTLAFPAAASAPAVAAMTRVARGPVSAEAVELVPGERLLVRLGGPADSLPARAARITETVGGAPAETLEGHAEAALWSDAAALRWAPSGAALVRSGLRIEAIAGLETALAAIPDVRWRVSLGATTAWIACPDSAIDDLDRALNASGLPATVLFGPPDRPQLGPATGGVFGARIARAIDPHERFLELRT